LLHHLIKDYNPKILITKTKATVFQETKHIRTEVMRQDQITEEENGFYCLGYHRIYKTES
jgi:hypothetical protein